LQYRNDNWSIFQWELSESFWHSIFSLSPHWQRFAFARLNYLMALIFITWTWKILFALSQAARVYEKQHGVSHVMLGRHDINGEKFLLLVVFFFLIPSNSPWKWLFHECVFFFMKMWWWWFFCMHCYMTQAMMMT
jgi:hypothetical protein